MTDESVDNNQLDGLDFNQLEGLLNSTTAGEARQPTQQAEESVPPSESDADPNQSETVEDAPEAAQKLTVKALAEKLGVDAADLYDQVEVLEGVTLGQYKDRVKDLQRADAILADATERQIATENELMTRRQALDSYAQRVGVQLSEKDLEAQREQAEQYLKHQQRLAVESIPEWKDETAKARDEKAIEKLGQEYGFSEAERRLMVDYRLVKMQRDYAALRETVRSVRDQRKQSRTSQKPRRHTETAGSLDKIKSQAAQDPKAAIDQLGRLLG